MRICFVGDSFVNGTCDPEFLGWTGRVCLCIREMGYNITYYNLGIRGETTADILARWPGEVNRRLTSEEAGAIVFSFGVNDTTIENGKLRVEFEDSVENGRKILEDARGRSPILMVGPPPISDPEQNLRISHLSEKFNSVCEQLSIPYLDVFPFLQSSAVWMGEIAANDGAHPGATGYRELARLVQNWEAWLSLFSST